MDLTAVRTEIENLRDIAQDTLKQAKKEDEDHKKKEEEIVKDQPKEGLEDRKKRLQAQRDALLKQKKEQREKDVEDYQVQFKEQQKKIQEEVKKEEPVAVEENKIDQKELEKRRAMMQNIKNALLEDDDDLPNKKKDSTDLSKRLEDIDKFRAQKSKKQEEILKLKQTETDNRKQH